MPLTRVRALVRNVLARDRVERDLDDEIRAALDLLIDEHRRRGIPAREARRAALLQLGGVESGKGQVREARAGASLDTFLRDVRYAARLLVRNPLFTLTAVLSLSIGIGATTSVFTVVNGLLVNVPGGVSEPDRLIEIARREDGDFGIEPISYPDYLTVRERATSVEDVYGYSINLDSMSLRASDSTERVFGGFVTMNFFDVLGVRAASGRLFGARDSERPGEAPIVVLSHSYWTRRFKRDTAVVGRTVTVNGQPMTVVGVAHAEFRGMSLLPPDLWIPAVMLSALYPERRLDFSPASQVSWETMMGGRLKPGVSRVQASADVAAIGSVLEREHEKENAFLRATGIPVPQGRMTWFASSPSLVPAGLRVPAAAFLSLLMALVAIVLIIACANLAGVLLARATVRRREMALRAAIGASQKRLVRQLLSETALLVLFGGTVGLLVARGATSLLVRLLPEFPLPVNLSVPLDSHVVLFSLSMSVVAALLAGLAPAIHGSKADVVTALKDDSQGPCDRLRLRNAFVVAQVALSILLVLMAGLLMRWLDRISALDPGYEARGVDVASIDLSMGGYNATSGSAFARELLDRVRALPGVQVATLADRAPAAGGLSLGGLSVPGATPPDGRLYFFANWNLIESDYFRTLGIRLIAGRDFGPGDRQSAQHVAIIGENAARRLWPGGDAVGQTFFVAAAAPDGPTPAQVPFVVVGVASDPRVDGFRGVVPLSLYVPFQQRYVPSLTIFARRGGEQAVAADLRRLVTTMNPNLPVLTAGRLDDQQNGPKQTSLRVAAAVAGSVGFVGLLLAAIGIYGVTAYTVTQRTREIGIRVALGARRENVVGMVLRQGMMLVALGSAIGLLFGGGIATVLQRAGAPLDGSVFVGTAFLFAAVGLVACYLPVRRAIRIGAVDALRRD
jgi:putative ABC transport system permease protein